MSCSEIIKRIDKEIERVWGRSIPLDLTIVMRPEVEEIFQSCTATSYRVVTDSAIPEYEIEDHTFQSDIYIYSNSQFSTNSLLFDYGGMAFGL